MAMSAVTDSLPASWETVVETLTFDYQPVVNVHTGRVFGFEALLRSYREAGFDSIVSVFDEAYEAGVLQELDLMLRSKAVGGFATRPDARQSKLFFNLDNRTFSLPRAVVPETAAIMRNIGLPNSALCFEISERHHLSDVQLQSGPIRSYRHHGFRVALDDFGSGYSGLQLLYYAQPDIVKIDRFLIAKVDTDPKKRVFVSSVVNMAHIMGMIVIAEGIETADEFRLCRDVGADLVQGFFVGRPTSDICGLSESCDSVLSIVGSDRRNRSTSKDVIARKMEYIEPVFDTDPIIRVLDRFRKDHETPFLPVVTDSHEPIGVLREKDLKDYVYSPFGIALLQNRNNVKNAQSFTSKAPIVDIHSRMEKVVEAYAINAHAEAVIITDNGRYCGLLQSRALIEALNERRLEEARDQNPLSRLPGNHTISEYLSQALSRADGSGYAFVYVDFDHFKVFNDTYGFRLGDRAIMIFADMLQGLVVRTGLFAGHIGGDDFFLGVSLDKMDFETTQDEIRALIAKFAETASGLYSQEDRTRGYVVAEGRDGRRKRYPLLSASAASISIPGPIAGRITTEQLSEHIATLKLMAKNLPEKYAAKSLSVIGEAVNCFDGLPIPSVRQPSAPRSPRP
jgi:EAL domain-containing protein (putative c-di-GMP-specific phosphodiesterase class I)/GGDEF domain-containing protein